MSERLPEYSDLDIVMDILRRILGEISPAEWLARPNKSFGGQAPIDIINGTDQAAKDELIHILQSFDTKNSR